MSIEKKMESGYHIDLSIITAQLHRYKDLFYKQGFHLLLAKKACPSESILRIASSILDGFDVSNHSELASVLPWCSANHLISITGPGLENVQLPNPFSCKQLFVNVDSPHQLEKAKILFPSALLGLRTAFSTTHRDNTAVPASRFGFSPAEASSILQSPESHISGLHFHEGRVEKSLSLYEGYTEQALKMAAETTIPLEFINFGGGLEYLGDADLETILATIRAKIPAHITLIFEPGDLLMRDAISIVGRSLGVRIDENRHRAVVTADISKECHLKWSSPSLQIPQVSGDERWEVLIYGSTCYENDLIGIYEVQSNSKDITALLSGPLIFSNVSPYSICWNHSFNGCSLAQVVEHNE